MTSKRNECCQQPETTGKSCCTLEAIITVDERGQMVLPKDVRKRAGIKNGAKLALISWEKEGKMCCMTLMKSDDFAEITEGVLRPVLGSIL